MNPLLEKSDAPWGAPQFGKITNADYMPAFKEAVRQAKEEVEAIASCPEPPDFANTIGALEYSGRLLSRVEGVFFNLLEAESDAEKEALAEEVSPMLSRLSVDISMNERLFERVKAVWENPGDLDVPSRRLLKETYDMFVRGGADLKGDDRKRFAEVSEELALMEVKFSNNVLAATNAFTLHVTDRSGLEGLPPLLVESAAAEAAAKGIDGWLFTLQHPSYGPFLKFSARRDLRERMWRAYNTRCCGEDHDNRAIICRIAALRREQAGLLGYGSYADYALEPRMARTRSAVEDFLKKLMDPSLPAARAEVAEIASYASANGHEGPLLPWDFPYWSEKYRAEKYNIDETLLSPYFRLEDVTKAVLGLAERLYGLTFNKVDNVSVYHSDVSVYEVKDKDGSHLALFYADFFPREGKRGGAWMTEFEGQYTDRDGTDHRPFISIVTNFSKPTSSTPSLLTHDELTTFLHEFGHALHGILSRGRYPSQCGTNVARDFVELPSQIMENWAYEPEFLDTFARHYLSGEKIPREYISRIAAAKNFQAAYLQVRQLQFGILDMAWHTAVDGPTDAIGFEHLVLAPLRTLPTPGDTATGPSFGHIFSGGYSAGYYSYKWAEVLEADAFELFRQNGIFDKETAASFRKNILERGSSEDEAVLFRNFRGHDPRPEALLKKLGIIS